MNLNYTQIVLSFTSEAAALRVLEMLAASGDEDLDVDINDFSGLVSEFNSGAKLSYRMIERSSTCETIFDVKSRMHIWCANLVDEYLEHGPTSMRLSLTLKDTNLSIEQTIHATLHGPRDLEGDEKRGDPKIAVYGGAQFRMFCPLFPLQPDIAVLPTGEEFDIFTPHVYGSSSFIAERLWAAFFESAVKKAFDDVDLF